MEARPLAAAEGVEWLPREWEALVPFPPRVLHPLCAPRPDNLPEVVAQLRVFGPTALVLPLFAALGPPLKWAVDVGEPPLLAMLRAPRHAAHLLLLAVAVPLPLALAKGGRGGVTVARLPLTVPVGGDQLRLVVLGVRAPVAAVAVA